MQTSLTDDLAGYGRGRTPGMPMLRLGIVVALHALLFAWWRMGVPAAPPDDPNRPAMVYINAAKPPPAPAPEPKKMPPPPSAAVRVPRVPRVPEPVHEPVPLWSPPTVMVAPEPEPEPEPANDAAQPSLAERARSGAGRADRELRAGERKVGGAAPLAGPDKFAVAVQSAFKPRATTMEDISTADGRRMTRVRGRGFSYCIVEEANQMVRGNDIFKNKQGKQVNCPN
ncbi:hypothetical protein [Massilia glaciei]|uniref:Uncharacterized protein n=1 Tax=Massilia glaciei TaxID=1524097 RepID=A0A2U2I4K8_9BURK|nr:hypothetical protein [Massilia glaciei]PWF54559.1 hypothetical protein C7C56_006350 [Massilia glaciei]